MSPTRICAIVLASHLASLQWNVDLDIGSTRVFLTSTSYCGALFPKVANFLTGMLLMRLSSYHRFNSTINSRITPTKIMKKVGRRLARGLFVEMAGMDYSTPFKR